MQAIYGRLRDKVYAVGLAMTILSLGIFWLTDQILRSDDRLGMFMINFSLTVSYWFIRLFTRKSSEKENRIHYFGLQLTLALISCFSLNREMGLFELSTNWFSGLLTLLILNFLSIAYFNEFPSWARHAASAVNGLAVVTFSYLACYLMPMYVLGILGLILFGISIHCFIPLFFIYFSLKLQDRMSQLNPRYWRSFIAGMGITFLFISGYVWQWNSTVKQLNVAEQTAKKQGGGLPTWATLAQTLPSDLSTERVLKSDLLYSTSRDSEGNFIFSGRGLISFSPMRYRFNLDEPIRHDPLIMLATLFSNSIDIPEGDRLRILKTKFGPRYEERERRWAGEDLYTTQVNTDVKIWPACNIAYTEKTLTVQMDSTRNSWRLNDEAVYTFQLSEGAVVSSLSLWINGVEEKATLTSKAKADSAYTTIVNSKRDPSVVHWQEGNRVTVRVFPVLRGDSRMFKIGVTSPLKRVDGKLQYENIYFKGPTCRDTKEKTLVEFEQPAQGYVVPASFVSQSKQSYKREGTYQPQWSLLFDDPGLTGCAFSFDGNTYALTPYHKRLVPASMTDIYLDVNASWTRDEFDQVIGFANGKRIYVYNGALVEVSAGSKEDIWKELSTKSFSLFPFFAVKDPAAALVITKCEEIVTPNIADLEGSEFLQSTKESLGRQSSIRLFNIGSAISPYLASLKEYRVFQYDQGDVAQLGSLLERNHYAADPESADRVVIHRADMLINKAPGTSVATGPDHVMRLFTYNHVMQQLGKGLFLNRPVQDSIVQEAEKAYVVTPVSSLIVLETQKDYERFDIKDSGDNLKNATIQSKGAVPEPHEWVLIILTGLTVLFVTRKRILQWKLK